jgi:hypothetical protein
VRLFAKTIIRVLIWSEVPSISKWRGHQKINGYERG